MRVNKNIILVDDSGYGVKTFLSAEAFLEDAAGSTVDGIMLLDQCMTGMSGLELQTELTSRGVDLPIIFITGHGDVQMSVKAVKAGAINFLEKPFSNEDLLASVSEAFSYDDNSRKHRSKVAALRKRLASLTAREREVIQHVVAGMSNKNLGELLGVCNRTIEVHRSRVMKKMGAESLPDLVRKYAMCQKTSL